MDQVTYSNGLPFQVSQGLREVAISPKDLLELDAQTAREIYSQ